MLFAFTGLGTKEYRVHTHVLVMRIFMVVSTLAHSWAIVKTAELIAERYSDNAIQFAINGTWLHSLYQIYLIHEFLVNNTPAKRDTLVYACWHALADTVIWNIYIFWFNFSFDKPMEGINYSSTLLLATFALNICKLTLVVNFRAKEDFERSHKTGELLRLKEKFPDLP